MAALTGRGETLWAAKKPRGRDRAAPMMVPIQAISMDTIISGMATEAYDQSGWQEHRVEQGAQLGRQLHQPVELEAEADGRPREHQEHGQQHQVGSPVRRADRSRASPVGGARSHQASPQGDRRRAR